jgi:hypothetical protein
MLEHVEGCAKHGPFDFFAEVNGGRGGGLEADEEEEIRRGGGKEMYTYEVH